MDVRAQRLLHVVEQRHVRGIVEAAGLQPMREHCSALAMPFSVSVAVLFFSSTT